MTRTTLLFTAASAVLALSTITPASAQTITNATQIKSGTYAVEPAHTQIGFSVLHFGFTNYFGAFSNASGALELNAQTPTLSRLSVTIPVASVQTTSSKLTDELKGPQWFDTAKFPNATFVSTSVKMVGQNTATINGNLTLHGVTKPVTLNVHFVGAGVNPMDKKYTTGFDATSTINRSDFGIKTYVPYVSDSVTLRIAGAFEKQD
ncbi:polyisoprenoid-binding protein [Acetobacter lambici]|uniref:YceI family protein n=1 Tax=Acetobacter lambici TaxID=1332824 RepID=A0ABT1F556_9PROT|nr:YceI family protein [Acetobacter lambici]MCP1243430.1 YceI family protein [Acetobacter lambici]MCP1259419.1 YceI family protein [Acetobacter lambici]NHO57674.1 polyisoprenoid-binding protein [Acetobacter lambici]